MKPRLIGLCSPAMGSGKTETARYMVKHLGFIRLAFATPLKNMTVALLSATGMDRWEVEKRVYGNRKEEVIPALGVSSRRIQQLIGTEFGRNLIKDSIWVDITLAAAAGQMKNGNSVVIDDMRFPNEYDAIHAAGGDTWRIVRPDAKVTVSHASEGQLDGHHMPEIFNGGTVADLHAEVDRLLSRL